MSKQNDILVLEDFHAGENRKALANTTSEYTTFVPSYIGKSWTWSDPEIHVLLERANLEIGKLDSFANQIPNIDVYVNAHLYTEANKSNRIEGTQTTIEEDMTPIEEIAPEKRDDHQEVQNYIKAINYGVREVTSPTGLPLCNRLLCDIHRILLEGVRGEYKTPGEFRRSQNWIGGANINGASYVPPPFEELPGLLTDFENFINNETILTPHLIRCAILHYQFETIHPFLDGNGRMGRLMIPLYLLNKRVLSKPCFYISDYFERRRYEYYDSLQRARVESDLSDWVKFFLKGAACTAQSASRKFGKVVALVEKHSNEILDAKVRSGGDYKKVLEVFYHTPVQSAKTLIEATGIGKSSMGAILKRLEEKGIVDEITGQSRNKLYRMTEYLQCFSDDE